MTEPVTLVGARRPRPFEAIKSLDLGTRKKKPQRQVRAEQAPEAELRTQSGHAELRSPCLPWDERQ